MSNPALRRVVRRETHSPRTVAVFVAVILVIVALAYAGVELVLYLAAQPALLLGPAAAWSWLIGLPSQQPAGLVIAGGIVLAVIGLIFIGLAVTPGRLPKHGLDGGSRAVIVDNGVLAAALAQHLSEEIGLARESITVGVAHRSIDVTLRPAAGIPLESADVKRITDAAISAYRPTRALRTRVRIQTPTEKELEE